MDFETLASAMTVLSFATFSGIVLWAYSARAKQAFDEAERLPFGEEDGVTGIGRKTHS
jgi:cytochrome c oxidase cbb3-type subunit 4